MKKVLHHIRKQPEHVKTRYVVVFAILATAVVIAVWLVTLQFIKKNDNTIKTESPLVMIKDIFKGQVSDLKDSLPQKKESLGDTLGTIPLDAPVDETQVQPVSSNVSTQPVSDDSGVTTQQVDPLPLPQSSDSN